ncbi:MAG: MgtC/SapB family protein [Tissierella sp.]|uniref:MgtC/SapB family protein n=1 Tax=Tissierella sp. TaxID=41274 RepID=UPI003F968859
MNETFTIIIRLFLSAVLGGAIGFERESHNRPAGFRTHILVTVGASLLMLVSLNVGPNADPSRIAAQVVSGIGFLGAGTILRTGNNIEGLTTAASLWVCSAIGLSIGNGYYLGGIISTFVVLFFLERAAAFEKVINRKSYKTIRIRGETRPGFIGEIGIVFGKQNIIIKNISIEAINIEDDIDEELLFTLKIPQKTDIEYTLNSLYKIDGIREVLLNDEKMENDEE